MPAVTSGKVLVTGASGYIGAWVVKYLVDYGFEVLVAMRSQSQIDFIVNRFPEYKGKVSGIIVPVIEAPGAYDEAVKEVDAIIHAASPAVWKFEDPSEVIDPAVKGATGILESAAKYGKNVKRVVLTSSVLAIVAEAQKEGEVYDESHWNTTTPEIVERDGKKADGRTVYTASKVLAERAAWDLVEKTKPAFDLVGILPTFNLGPYVHEVTKSRGVGSTVAVFLSILPTPDVSGKLFGTWVDVRDSAEHHVLALTTPEASGERIASVAEPFAWQDVYDVLIDAGIKSAPGKETYGLGKSKALTPRESNEKSLKLFPQVKYRSLADSVKPMGEQLVKDGFL